VISPIVIIKPQNKGTKEKQRKMYSARDTYESLADTFAITSPETGAKKKSCIFIAVSLPSEFIRGDEVETKDERA